MFNHITLIVSDFKRAAAFYRQALEPLGLVQQAEYEGGAGFGPPGEPRLWIQAGPKPARVHVAFTAPTQAAVKAFHRAALAAGGKDNGEPGIRVSYSPTYFAAFAYDPDGNNVEAVCLGK